MERLHFAIRNILSHKFAPRVTQFLSFKSE